MSGEPRVPPLAPDEWPSELQGLRDAELQGSGATMGQINIFRTLVRHPGLFRAWLPLGGFLLGNGRLSARDRELLILRTAVLCRSAYEWGQHVRIAQSLGVERADIDRVAEGPDAGGWTAAESALLRAADELHAASVVSDATWAALAGDYDEQQLIEVAMLVGHYHMVAFALNSLGVQLEDGLEGLPDTARS